MLCGIVEFLVLCELHLSVLLRWMHRDQHVIMLYGI